MVVELLVLDRNAVAGDAPTRDGRSMITFIEGCPGMDEKYVAPSVVVAVVEYAFVLETDGTVPCRGE
jgi:hypothetical protein